MTNEEIFERLATEEGLSDNEESEVEQFYTSLRGALHAITIHITPSLSLLSEAFVQDLAERLTFQRG